MFGWASFAGGFSRNGIAKDAVARAPLERLDDSGCRFKIGVGYPHGQHVAAGVAFPLFASGSRAVHHAVKD
jgi:hypothetical protein